MTRFLNGMSHEEVAELLGVYALDGWIPKRPRCVQAHLSECPVARPRWLVITRWQASWPIPGPRLPPSYGADLRPAARGPQALRAPRAPNGIDWRLGSSGHRAPPTCWPKRAHLTLRLARMHPPRSSLWTTAAGAIAWWSEGSRWWRALPPCWPCSWASRWPT